ncbi:EAL and HDOD domain-containing protein [Lacimicrobium alkaliphilum]|uniref:Histidine kinase n=1 Tax=Lacimicrobium alkaliphilum TaxID=1526571 RepID=A0ABQ1R7W7_9ALTE|nr:HDOD domain-containing protein [Lacimicrobium alkaliphilum]GGD61540.1 histidine kinase [Lacimicrobium alkaliphilum]
MNYHYLARQPILDSQERTYGYELLYRDSEQNAFPAGLDDEKASSRLFYESLLFDGTEKITEDKKAFVNISAVSLLQKIPDILPPGNLVIEIVERSLVNEGVVEVIKALHAKGYVFALDDYDGKSQWDVLEPYMHYVKVEIQNSPLETARHIELVRSRFPTAQIIVERVETYDDFDSAKLCGADYFQGYFFARPEMMQKINLNPAQMTVVQLMALATGDSLDYQRVSDVLKKDIGLASRVLRLANIACKTRKQEIVSIKSAATFLGEQALRKFIVIVSVSQLTTHKPFELMRLALTRALFMQLLGEHFMPKRSDTLFLLGLLSLLDAMLSISTDEVIDTLHLNPEFATALRAYEGELGNILSIVTCIETNDWSAITSQPLFNYDNGQDPDVFSINYQQACDYADELLKELQL